MEERLTEEMPDAALTADVVAMQFAAGRTIAELAAEWGQDAQWVEGAIRAAMLSEIPERDGGLKPPRAEERAERSEAELAVRKAQGLLGFDL